MYSGAALLNIWYHYIVTCTSLHSVLKIPFWFSYKVLRMGRTTLHDQKLINSKVFDGKVQKYLPYNGVFPGKITIKSCNLGAFINASVTRFAACSLSFAIFWKWQLPILIPIFPLNIKIKLFKECNPLAKRGGLKKKYSFSG